MSQEVPPISLDDGATSPSYYVYENSLAIIQFQCCWICKGWSVCTLGVDRFYNDASPPEYCASCYQFVNTRVKLKCEMWRQIMEESVLPVEQRTITGESIRANAPGRGGHRRDYLSKLRKDWMYRTTIMNVPENRVYNAECASPFDAACEGRESLRLNK